MISEAPSSPRGHCLPTDGRGRRRASSQRARFSRGDILCALLLSLLTPLPAQVITHTHQRSVRPYSLQNYRPIRGHFVKTEFEMQLRFTTKPIQPRRLAPLRSTLTQRLRIAQPNYSLACPSYVGNRHRHRDTETERHREQTKPVEHKLDTNVQNQQRHRPTSSLHCSCRLLWATRVRYSRKSSSAPCASSVSPPTVRRAKQNACFTAKTSFSFAANFGITTTGT